MKINLDLEWIKHHEWWHWDEEKCIRVLNDDAPEEAWKSYEHYLEQMKSKAI